MSCRVHSRLFPFAAHRSTQSESDRVARPRTRDRHGIARALAPEPSILIADEPTGNLDADTGRDIIRLMFEARARRGATLVLVTHDRALADACDRRIVMRSGEIVEDIRAGVAP